MLLHITRDKICNLAQRALPLKMCLYKHAITLYKLVRNQCPEHVFLHLNFQMTNNNLSRKITFVKHQRFNVGKNILLNRMHSLNNMIEKSWLDLGIDSYKVQCKNLFLTNNWNYHKQVHIKICTNTLTPQLYYIFHNFDIMIPFYNL